MTSAIPDTVKRAYKNMTATAKVADLDCNTIYSESYKGPSLTTDHGVKVANTDDWYRSNLPPLHIRFTLP